MHTPGHGAFLPGNLPHTVIVDAYSYMPFVMGEGCTQLHAVCYKAGGLCTQLHAICWGGEGSDNSYMQFVRGGGVETVSVSERAEFLNVLQYANTSVFTM